MPTINSFPINTTPLPTSPFAAAITAAGPTIITAINTALGSTCWQECMTGAAFNAATNTLTLSFSDGSTIAAVINSTPGAGTITNIMLAANSVTSANIVNGTIVAADLAATGVGAGTYGDSLTVAQVTVNAQGQVTNAVNVPIATMVGSTALVAGTRGLVPAPAAGDNLKYLRGDGTWQTVAASGVDLNLTVSAQTGSAAGIVPINPPGAPDAGDIHLETYSDKAVWWSYTAGVWVNVAEIAVNPAAPVAANAVSPRADDNVGAVGVGTEYAREDHKHPAQLPSAAVGNRITQAADGLHFLDDMTGATALVAGAAGTAPAPAAGDQGKFLRGDGTWQTVSAAAATPVRDVNATDSPAITDGYLLIDATAGALTINLPDVQLYTAGVAGVLTLKRVDTTANVVTVDGFGAQTVETPFSAPIAFAATQTINSGEAFKLVADRTNNRWVLA